MLEPIYRVDGRSTLTQMLSPGIPVPRDFTEDPRGIIWLFEPPNPRASYTMGIDPSRGIPQWHRDLRREDDIRIDNGAIVVTRCGEDKGPDVQVAEYAAPCDPYDLAPIANTLGRLYGGRNEDGQALCIVEVWPGPGLMTQRELIDTFGYTNLFVHKYLNLMAVQNSGVGTVGFQAHQKTVRDLWIMNKRHLELDKYHVLSPWLSKELHTCEEDPIKMTGKAVYGKHDDRVRAAFMSAWAAHDWTDQVEPRATSEVTSQSSSPNWQASDITLEGMMDAWEEAFEREFHD